MAWTLIDLDTSWQDLPVAVQIWDQYDRRQRVLADLYTYPEGTTVVSPIVAPLLQPDSDVTVFDFIKQMQENIEQMATDIWVDPTIDLASIYNVEVPPSVSDPTHLTWTKDEYMTEAGLTATGYWRRLDEEDNLPTDWGQYDGAGFSYGQIQDKDMAGPWLFQDLQTALTKMTRTYLVGEATASQPKESNTTIITDWVASSAWGACDTNDDVVLDPFTGFMNPHVIPATSLLTSVFIAEKYRIDGEISTDPDTGLKYAYAVTGPLEVTLSTAAQSYVIGVTPISYIEEGFYQWTYTDGIGWTWVEEAGFYRGWETQTPAPAATMDISPSDLSVADCAALKAYADTKLPDAGVTIQSFPGEEHDRMYQEGAWLKCVIADFNFWL